MTKRKSRSRKGKPPLTAERVRELLFYDQYDGKFTWMVGRRGKARAGKEAGALDSDGYRLIMVDGVTHRASRLAFLWVLGRWPRREAEHRDGNPGDDSFLNLREATRSQNNANRRLNNSSSGWKWAHPQRDGRFSAVVSFKGKTLHVGTFDSAPEAHQAAWVVAREVHGEFCRIK